MNNKQIAKSFKLLANLLELYEENPFKIKQYENAYNNLRKIEDSLIEMSEGTMSAIPGIGKGIIQKINEIRLSGKINELDQLLEKTPAGIVDMLSVRGLGPKKVKSIWQEMKIESISDLLLACNENRLVAAKGFGHKTQESIKNKLEFFISNTGKYLYAAIQEVADELMDSLQQNGNEYYEYVGSLAMMSPIVENITILTTDKNLTLDRIQGEDGDEPGEYKGLKISEIVYTTDEQFHYNHLQLTCNEELFKLLAIPESEYDSKEDCFIKNNKIMIPIESRENIHSADFFKTEDHDLINERDIKGVVHTHTTYSDGLNSIADMAKASISKGYEYLVISDHSVSAFYANGLSIERVEMQWREIEQYNQKNKNFKIYKGIESDILNDGRLDYPDEILAEFDVVIASVHSNLEMDINKATQRIITAIENPYTDILGHPTGRLLLGRKGYELDMMKVIDACAANNVVIELNANPQRLDLDWSWITIACEKGVRISINPDAHSVGQIDYIKHGVNAARKGCLTRSMCLNALNKNEFDQWLIQS
jgi:DNA polymerase (family X)